MPVTARDKTILWGRAAARCSHPACRRLLIADSTVAGQHVLVGEVAHIVAQKPDGPRGDQIPPGGTRDGQQNLILLCQEHHTTVDRQPRQYPVSKLVQWKLDHEQWVNSQLFSRDQLLGLTAPAAAITERVYSTLLPVQHVPRFIHLAECSDAEDEISRLIDYTGPRSGLMAPFIVRGGNLLTFADLDDEDNPFRRIVDPYSTEKHHAEDWWDDPDQYRWYVQLLNRSLNKLTGRLGLNLDKDHKRYYFEPTDVGDRSRSVDYISIGGRRQSRNVVWQPAIKATGEKRHYWEHLAVGLRFHRTSKQEWCLSIRPERRFTLDGTEPLTPKGTGRRSTSRKSHMYNIDVLGEVHFWRHYLAHGQPRVIMRFGKQSLIMRTNLLSTDAVWPEIPKDTDKHLTMMYEDDLVSMADYNEAIEFEDDDALSIETDSSEDLDEDDAAE